MNNIISESERIREENKARQLDNVFLGKLIYPSQVKEDSLCGVGWGGFQPHCRSPRLFSLCPHTYLPAGLRWPHQAELGDQLQSWCHGSGPAFLRQASSVPGLS